MAFSDRLSLTLNLMIGNETFTVPGGSIKRLQIDLTAFGFEAELTFHVSAKLEADPIFPHFHGRDAIRVSVSATVPLLPPGAPVPDPLLINGIVTERKLVETTDPAVATAPISLRAYTVRFADPAAVLWREHFPCELHTDATMKELIDAHRQEGISVTHDWDALTEERKMICVGLGVGEADFYDFVVGFVRAQGGVFEYDASARSYRIAGAKAIDATPSSIDPDDVAEVAVAIPEPGRDDVRLSNSFAEATATETVARAGSVSGVRRDLHVLTPIAARFERQVSLEKKRILPREDGAELEFRRFPRSTFRPGKFVLFAERWSDRTRVAAKPYRVVALQLDARASGGSALPDANLEEDEGDFEMTARATLELASNPAPNLPETRPVAHPIYVEGKIVSAGGEDDERTRMPIDDEKNRLTTYQVHIPLWNKKISVPYEPGFWPGHFYFPAYKHERVLISMGFDTARISRFLDWAANARLPQESQGNRIVFGKRAADGTTIEHKYLDGKPMLVVQRTQGKDLQTIEVSEGLFRMEVKEDATAAAVEPKYDVSIQVEAAKGQVSTQVGGSIAAVTGDMEAAVGGVNVALASTTAELDGSLSAMESQLGAKIDAVKAELDGLATALESTADAVAATVAAAKAEILGAVS